MKIRASVSVAILLLISVSNGYAQPGGDQYCPDGVTPYTPDGCPLDTWVIFLVAVASVYAGCKLLRRNKMPS